MLALSSSAFADAETGQWYLTGMASYIDDDEDRRVDDGFAGGQIGVGRAINDVLNLEAFLARAALDGFNEQDQLSGGVDLQLLFGRENKWTPYLFAGAGYMEVNPLTAATEQGVLFSGGAGLLADIFGSSPVAARLEYRYRIDEAFADSLGDHIVSIGLQIPLGSQRPMPAPAPQPEPEGDGDNDGVPDSRDRCPNTPAGVEVDRTGCALDSLGVLFAHVEHQPATFARLVEVGAHDRRAGSSSRAPVDIPRIVALPELSKTLELAPSAGPPP